MGFNVNWWGVFNVCTSNIGEQDSCGDEDKWQTDGQPGRRNTKLHDVNVVEDVVDVFWKPKLKSDWKNWEGQIHSTS